MENDNGVTEKAQLFRDLDFMLLGVAMASQVIGDAVNCLEVDHNDNGRIVGWIEKKFNPDSPYFFEMKPNLTPEGIWSRHWDFTISDTYGRRAQIIDASLGKHTATWIKATIALL